MALLLALITGVFLSAGPVLASEPPVCCFDTIPELPEGEPPFVVDFDATCSSDVNDDIVKYRWTFGDGSSDQGIMVRHEFTKKGDYRVCLTVTDADGNKDKCCETIRVWPYQAEAVPQVRWAGEQIVLEKYWGKKWRGHWVNYLKDHRSPGCLEDGCDNTWVQVDNCGVSRVLFGSTDQGEVHVTAELWGCMDGKPCGTCQCREMVINKHEFKVYYLKLETVKLRRKSSSKTNLIDKSIKLSCTVKGWFLGRNLSVRAARIDPQNPFELLPAGRWVLPDDWPVLAGWFWEDYRPHWDIMDESGDSVKSGPYPLGLTSALGEPAPIPGNANLGIPWQFPAPCPMLGWPAGHYYDFGRFPPLPVAECPVVGPYSSLDDYTPLVRQPLLGRKTIVPNGRLTKDDCPMPPAKVRFRILFAASDLGFFQELLKRDIYYRTEIIGFDITTGEPIMERRYTKPFYYTMIPAHKLIPPYVNNGGYDWNSWDWPGPGGRGPYEFWTVVDASRYVDNQDPFVVFWWDPIYGTSQRSVANLPSEVVVYSDNTAEARVLINGLANLDVSPYITDIGGYDLTDVGLLGRSVVRAYVDYPYFRNFPTFRSNSRTLKWRSGFSVRTSVVPMGPGQWKLIICKKNISGVPVECEKVQWTLTDGEGAIIIADPNCCRKDATDENPCRAVGCGEIWDPLAAHTYLGQDGCTWIIVERHSCGEDTHVKALLPCEMIKRNITIPATPCVP